MCQDFDIESDVIPRIAAGFGGGIGNSGAVCGAVVGAVMALSLQLERDDSREGYFQLAGVLQEFRQRFEAELGTINCRELTGVDLTTEEGLRQSMSSDVPQKVCFPAVASAYRLVGDLLEEN